jgi:hypothetical protein
VIARRLTSACSGRSHRGAVPGRGTLGGVNQASQRGRVRS